MHAHMHMSSPSLLSADMDQVGLEKTSPAGKLLFGASIASVAAGSVLLWTTGVPLLRLVAGVMLLVTLLMLAVLRKGGIME